MMYMTRVDMDRLRVCVCVQLAAIREGLLAKYRGRWEEVAKRWVRILSVRYAQQARTDTDTDTDTPWLQAACRRFPEERRL